MTRTSLLWAAPLLLVACAVDHDTTHERATAATTEAIVAGTADKHDASVVMVLQQPADSPGNYAFICTGAIVAPHVVLTAAHCLDPKSVGAGEFSVFVGNDIDDSTQWSDQSRHVVAASTHIHPDWVLKTVDTTHDVGVIVTKTALTPTPLPMNRDTLGNDFVGAALRVVGAGQTSATDTNSSGHMFELNATVKALEAEHIVFADPTKSMCHGDSGGPTLAQRGGKEVIVGVHSGTAQDCKGDNLDTRLELYAKSFVDPLIEQADPGFLPPDSSTGGTDAGGTSSGDTAANGEANGQDSKPADAAAPESTSTSGCSLTRSNGSTDAVAGFGLFVIAAGLVRRRRR